MGLHYYKDCLFLISHLIRGVMNGQKGKEVNKTTNQIFYQREIIDLAKPPFILYFIRQFVLFIFILT